MDSHDFLKACLEEQPIEAAQIFEKLVSSHVATAYEQLLPVVAKEMLGGDANAKDFFTKA